MLKYCNEHSLSFVLSPAVYLEFNSLWMALIFCSIRWFEETRQIGYDVIITANLAENFRVWTWRHKHRRFSIASKVYTQWSFYYDVMWPWKLVTGSSFDIYFWRWSLQICFINTVYIHFRLIWRRWLQECFLNIDYFNLWVLWLALWVDLVVHWMNLIIREIENQWDLNKFSENQWEVNH